MAEILEILALAGTCMEAIPNAGPQGTRTDDPTPMPTRYLKDVISVGSYKHPVTGEAFDVTANHLDKWCSAFDAMAKDGIKVPIYSSHKGSTDAHMGYCAGMTRGGKAAFAKYPELSKLPADKAPLDENRLYAIHEFPDKAAADKAGQVGQVSAFINKRYKGGNGNNYGSAIQHIAVTPEPVIPGQTGFCALSREDQDHVFVLGLLKDSENENADGVTDMTPKQLADLVAILPEAARKDVTVENITAALSAHTLALSAEITKATDELKLSRETPAIEIDPEIVEAQTVRLSALVDAGKITPACAKALEPVIIGTAEKPQTIALSRKATGTPKSLASMVLTALESNVSIQLGEKTGAQRPLALAREDEAAAADASKVDEAFNAGAQRRPLNRKAKK
jgi:hypothetical protein